MNFFDQQEIARRRTRTLVLLFAAAVILIVLAVNAVAALAWSLVYGAGVPGRPPYPHGFFVTNTLITMAVIGAGSLIELFRLREGGDAVAKMAGGRLLPLGGADPLERRLQNVVAEMALAAGIACPRVYLLDAEPGINAFAAGYNINQAVIAITRGALESLSREELQGVVAHEFSHILNGDMRLNVRLIGLLFGIQMLAGLGRFMLEAGRTSGASGGGQRKEGSPRAVMLLLGVALILVGYIGIFFGRMIKAAVSRQREFLADASAVQFTRNPAGIGNALRKIGGLAAGGEPGSRIRHPNAEQLSHLFLAEPRAKMLGLLATHPPIKERVRRIFGRSLPMLAAVPLTDAGNADAAAAAQSAMAGASGLVPRDQAQGLPPAPAMGGSGFPAAGLPGPVQEALRDPESASLLVHALVLGGARDVLPRTGMPLEMQQRVSTLSSLMQPLPGRARWPLLDLAMPALRLLTGTQKKELQSQLRQLVAADTRVSIAEFALLTVLEARLLPHAGRAHPYRYRTLAPVARDCALLLSMMSHVARPAAPQQAFAAGITASGEPALAAMSLSPPQELGHAAIRAALANVAGLRPLARPALVKMLLAAAGDASGTDSAVDLLNAICAAIDSPLPESMAGAIDVPGSTAGSPAAESNQR